MPFPVAIIDLAEGVRMPSNVLGDPRNLGVGDPVQVDFIERNDAVLPVFRRAP